MKGDNLRYVPTSTGWKLDAEAAVLALVSGLFGTDIQVDKLPKAVTSVGHYPVGERWLVIIKPAGRREIRGRLMDDAAYDALGLDPFAALEGIAEDDALADALRDAPSLRTSAIVDELETVATAVRSVELFAAEGQGYLTLAYAAFLRGSLAQRRKPYWSALPLGHQPSEHPLSRFAASGERRSGNPNAINTMPRPALNAPMNPGTATTEANASALATQAQLAALKSEVAAIAASVRENAGGIALLRSQVNTPAAPSMTAAPPSIGASPTLAPPPDAVERIPAGRETAFSAAAALLILAVSFGAAVVAAIKANDAKKTLQEAYIVAAQANSSAKNAEGSAKNAAEVRDDVVAQVTNASSEALAKIEKEAKAASELLAGGREEFTTARNKVLDEIDSRLLAGSDALQRQAARNRAAATAQAAELAETLDAAFKEAFDEIGKEKDAALNEVEIAKTAALMEIDSERNGALTEVKNFGALATGKLVEAIKRITGLTEDAIACIEAKRTTKNSTKIDECEFFADTPDNGRQ